MLAEAGRHVLPCAGKMLMKIMQTFLSHHRAHQKKKKGNTLQVYVTPCKNIHIPLFEPCKNNFLSLIDTQSNRKAPLTVLTDSCKLVMMWVMWVKTNITMLCTWHKKEEETSRDWDFHVEWLPSPSPHPPPPTPPPPNPPSPKAVFSSFSLKAIDSHNVMRSASSGTWSTKPFYSSDASRMQ